MAQINKVLIPCLVIKQNNEVFKTVDNVVGQVYMIPCRETFVDEIPYWLVPVKDTIFSTFDPILATGANLDAPTFDSIYCLRIRDKLSSTTWWVYVINGISDFLTSCNTCCDSPAIPMPGTSGGFLIRIAPTQTLCELQNAEGQYQTLFGIPSLPAGYNYFPYGSYNNVELPAASPTGYSTIAALIAFMSSTWNVSSVPMTYVASEDGLTITATGGSLYDKFGIVVTTVLA